MEKSDIIEQSSQEERTPEIKADFINWLENKQWEEYIQYKMDLSIKARTIVNSWNIVIPNGTVKEDYLVEISIPDDVKKTIIEYDFIGLEAINATYEKFDDKIVIKGKPEEPGTYDIVLRYKYDGWLQGFKVMEKSFIVNINPDPRSLWQDIPTQENIIFYKPDYDHDYVKVEAGEDGQPKKDIVAASLRGRSHANKGTPRDDHFKVAYCDKTEWYVLAVADGAGSAKYSRKGSEVACNTVMDVCLDALKDTAAFEKDIEKFATLDAKIKELQTSVVENVQPIEGEEAAGELSTPEVQTSAELIAELSAEYATTQRAIGDVIYKILAGAALKAHKVIDEVAASNSAEKHVPKDYATTLLLTICKKFSFGWFVASFWIGDGAICLFNKEKKTAKILGIPDEGEFSGQTRFLTMKEIFRDSAELYRRLRFSIEEDFTALMMMSDGVSDPWFGTEAKLNSYDEWEKFWNLLLNGIPEDDIKGVELIDDNSESQYQLLEWLNFWVKGEHDDRTIAILY